jgi:hypothetical protein
MKTAWGNRVLPVGGTGRDLVGELLADLDLVGELLADLLDGQWCLIKWIQI